MIKNIIISAGLMLFIPVVTSATEVAVITGASFPKDTMTSSEVKDIYLGKAEMLDGKRLKPVDLKGAAKKDFLEKVVGLSEDEYKSYWIKRVFREGGSPPAVKNAADDVISAVKEENGMIGYISADEAKGKGGIKVLLTIK